MSYAHRSLILSLSGAAPMFGLPALINFLIDGNNRIIWGIGLLLFIIISVLALYRIHQIKVTQTTVTNSTIKNIEQDDKQFFNIFIFYFIPLCIDSASSFSYQTLLEITTVYWLLLIITNTSRINLIFPILNYHLYKITTNEDLVFMILSKKTPQNIKSRTLTLVKLDPNCYIEL
jgi:hypothetical protein